MKLKCLIALWLCGAALTPAWAAAEEADAPWNYRITLGDTLIGISAQMLERPDDWPKLQRLNRIENPRRLPPGGTIRIPLELLKKSAMVATVIFVRGQATVSSRPATAERTERPLTIGDAIGSRDVIRTGDDSSLSLRFADGSRLMVGPRSQVSVVRIMQVGRSALPDARLDIDHGDAEIHIVPNAGRRFELRTPAMNLGVRGTSFRARVDPDGKAAGVEVLEGRIGAEAGPSQVAVDAGFGTRAEADKPITPPRPLLPAPVLADVARFFDRFPLRFAWPTVPGAVAYRAQILAPGDGERLLLDERIEQANVRWPDLPDGSYSLRVRGIDASGLEGFDAQQQLVVKARPLAPLARAPVPESTSIGVGTRFEWAGVTEAARYRLQIARDAEFHDIVFDDATISQTSRELALPPGRYHWRMASITTGPDGKEDAGPLSPAQVFVQRIVPPRLELTQPESGPAGIRLRWAPTQPGQSVHLQIASDPDFRRLEFYRTTSDANEIMAELGPGDYFVRARIIDADGLAGDYGSVRRFSVPLPYAPWWLLPLGWLLLL